MLLTVSSALLLSLLIAPSTQYTFFSPRPHHHIPSVPFQVPQYQNQDVKHISAFTKLRNVLVKSIWSVSENCRHEGNVQSVASPIPPNNVVSRFKDDVVLRFTISSEEEAKALKEAASVLFLDVWDFAVDWADIRLATDVVGIQWPHAHLQAYGTRCPPFSACSQLLFRMPTPL